MPLSLRVVATAWVSPRRSVTRSSSRRTAKPSVTSATSSARQAPCSRRRVLPLVPVLVPTLIEPSRKAAR